MAAEVISRAVSKGKRVLFLAPRRELIHQAAEKLELFGVRHGWIMAGVDDKVDIWAAVQIASFDTLVSHCVRRKKKPLPSADLVIVDEAHLSLSVQRAKVIQHYQSSGAIVVGLSATPIRGDGKGLGAIYDSIVETASVSELQDQGLLVPNLRIFAPAKPDLDGVKIARGDYVVGQLERRMQPLLGDVLKHWLRLAADKRTVIFCCSRKHSVFLADQFRQHGIAAEHVDGSTPADERRDILARVRSGETQVLCNVFVASYGLDIPELDCAVLARPTRSVALYLQMVGRVLRQSPGKTEALLLDHGGVVNELGMPTAAMEWSLDDSSTIRERNDQRRKKEPKEITCSVCANVYKGQLDCPNCGHIPAMRGKDVETVEAELREITPKAKAANATMGEKADFFAQLIGFAEMKGRKPGWAAHQYRAKFGVWPNDPRIKNAPAREPSRAVLGWIRSRQIAYAKRKAI